MHLSGAVTEIWHLKVQVHTHRTMNRTTNLLISSNFHYVHLGGDNYTQQQNRLIRYLSLETVLLYWYGRRPLATTTPTICTPVALRVLFTSELVRFLYKILHTASTVT